MKEALQAIESLSNDKAFRRQEEIKREQEFFHNWDMKNRIEETRKEMQDMLEKSRKETQDMQEKIDLNLKKTGMALHEISKATGLSEDRIKQLLDK